MANAHISIVKFVMLPQFAIHMSLPTHFLDCANYYVKQRSSCGASSETVCWL